MPPNHRRRLLAAVAALVLAVLLYWLAADDRAGSLGMLQQSLAFFFVLPYIVGAVVAGNAHDPNSLAFFVALLVEVYAVIALASALVRRVTRSIDPDRA